MISTLELLEQYSESIYSDKKKERQIARKEIIRLTSSFKKMPKFSQQDKDDFPAWEKVSKQLMNLLDYGNFPYQINREKAGIIAQFFDITDSNPTAPKDFEMSDRPCYIVTMAHHPHLTDLNFKHLSGQINLITDEGFSDKVSTSRKEAAERLAIVVGINYCRSLDKVLNKQNREYVYQAESLGSTHVKIIGFNWEPVWVKGNTSVSQKKVKRLFQLFADIKPKKAQTLFKDLMVNKREFIPMQRIRDVIVKTAEVAHFYKTFTKTHKHRPSMLGILDDDAILYRTDKKRGLLSHYDKLIESNPDLKVASTGYYMKSSDQDFVEFASRADLVARQAIADYLPNGAYFPEPNLFIKIIDLNMLENKISFIRKSPNKGKGLEFLGLLENLGLNKGDVRGKVVMGKEGPILTSAPRVKIPAHIPAILTPIKINNIKNLASLRMFCQTVLNPKKGFAASVARAMPQGTGSAVNTAKISKLYTAFDPIDYIKVTPDWNVIYEVFVENLIKIYDKKIDKASYKPNFDQYAKEIVIKTHKDKSKIDEISSFLEDKFTDLWSARSGLMNELPNLSDDEFYSLYVSALNANLAVYTYLKSRIDKVPFVFPVLYS